VQANPPLRFHDSQSSQQAAPASIGPIVEPMLIPADVAGPMCGRSEASWWRDHAAGRNPAPVKLGGRTLWRTEELRRWVEAGCPVRKVWEALQASGKGGRK
jgi:predicted DNA-binding transcriptional regulator AlpA